MTIHPLQWTQTFGHMSGAMLCSLLPKHINLSWGRQWLWKSKFQMKHKVFFWLLLKDRLSTRDLLWRKNMELDSYTCDLCILQKLKSAAHLFLRCNFAKACWYSVGISVVTTRSVTQIIDSIRRKLEVPFSMDIIIIMSWSIWVVRNDWIFNGQDPSMQACKQKFMSEFNLLLHRIKPDKAPSRISQLDSL
jgi:hypothetical protein